MKAAIDMAELVVAQVNRFMPRVHGSGFIPIDRVNYLVEYDEPLLTFEAPADTEMIRELGRYVARLVKDGDTIQVGYGATPNAIMAALAIKNIWVCIPS
jgi:acyl-CoA hydrolase